MSRDGFYCSRWAISAAAVKATVRTMIIVHLRFTRLRTVPASLVHLRDHVRISCFASRHRRS